MGKTIWTASRILARENALEEATKADRGRSSEQIGAYRLGFDGPRWHLSSSSVWRCVTQGQKPRDVGNVVRSNGGLWAIGQELGLEESTGG